MAGVDAYAGANSRVDFSMRRQTFPPQKASGIDHAIDHEGGGAQELDGDHLDIDFNPSDYTPDASISEADNIDHLAAHLKGISDKLGSLVTGLSWKQAVRVGTTANIDLSSAPIGIDTIGLSSGDRVLVKDQSVPEDNGIYDYNGSGSPMTRSSDADIAAELIGATLFVTEGAVNADKGFHQTIEPITLGVTGLVWEQFASAPLLHASTHENGGVDEINVAGLSGLLADDQNPVNHATDHQNGGGDEINVAGLSGLLADDQNPVNHATDHQNGGGDEINVAGLSGLLADDQNPVNHATDHQNGGGDEINVGGLSGLLADAQNPLSHAITHEQSGLDKIDGDKLEIDFSPANYTQDSSIGEADNDQDLSAHLKGISDELGTLKTGLAWKDSARVATISDISLGSAPVTIDGISVFSGERVLVKNQIAAGDNGIYDFNGSGSSMTRSSDADTAAKLVGATLFITEGSTNADLGFHQTVEPISLGATALVFSQFASAPIQHGSTHEDGGNDEINVDGLSGLLADDQNPVNHGIDHENGGGDEINVGGLSGLLADAQTPLSHSSTHIKDGSDELDADQVDIDFFPNGYTPDPSIPQATSSNHLAAHLNGIATRLREISQELSWKDAARVASTANVNLASAPVSIDGIALNQGDRVLVKNQTLPKENGIYDWQEDGFAMARTLDADSALKLLGATILVREGTVNKDVTYKLLTDNVTLDTTALTWISDISELSWKDAARVGTTANINLASAPTSIDGITLSVGDRVLVKDQTAGEDNGIYDYQGATSTMTRSADADLATELEGAAIFIREGTVNEDIAFFLVTDSIVLDTTALVWIQFSSKPVVRLLGLEWRADSTGPSKVTTGKIEAFELPDGGSKGVETSFVIPDGNKLIANPMIHVSIVVFSAGSGNNDVDFDVGAKYIAVGDLTTKTDDETISFAVPMINTVNEMKHMTFELDRSLIGDDDHISLNQVRDGSVDAFDGSIALLVDSHVMLTYSD